MKLTLRIKRIYNLFIRIIIIMIRNTNFNKFIIITRLITALLYNYSFSFFYFKINSIRPMMHVIYLLIRATFSQKTYDALKLNYLFVFHSPKKKEEEEEEEERRGVELNHYV